MNKPSTKITPAIRARCEEIARLKLQIPSYRRLELETGIAETYLAKLVHYAMRRIKRNKVSVCVSRGTEAGS